MTLLASPPVRRRTVRSLLNPTRLTTALAALLLLLLALPHAIGIVAYLVLVLVTAVVLRGVRAEPGSWLGQPVVRRGLVVLMAAVCVALAATPAPTSPQDSSGLGVLFLLLVVLNVALGRATQRIATAPDSTVDERQEALRNRAHRIAYALLAVGVGGTALVADQASSQSRSWLATSLGGGGFIVFLELLFVLPAMVLAFLEPARIPRERGDSAAHPRARLAGALLALTLAIPVVLSLAVLVVPEHLSQRSQLSTGSISAPAAVPAVAQCREFLATRSVGLEIGAGINLHALACWDGRRASESFGMNASDCLAASTSMVTVRTTECQRVTGVDGTLTFTYRSQVSPALLPFLHRDVTMRLVIDRNGNVERFP